jgi:hypothetical protein
MTSGSKAKPSTDEIDVQAVDVEPTRRGYQVTYNYAVRFWLPILGPVAYAVWQTLISFCYGDRETCWPSISLLADIATRGNRNRVTGRWRGVGDDRRRQPGALEKLEDHGLLTVTTRNAGPETRYTFHVVKEPPLLPPDLLDQLPKRLRQMHTDLLTRCGMDLSTYQQLATGGGAQGPGGGAQGTGGGAQGTGGGAQGPANQYKESKLLEEIWRETKSRLLHKMTRANFSTYIKDTHALAFDRNLGILIIQTPNPLTSRTLADTFQTLIMRTIQEANVGIDGVPVYDVQFQSKR